MAGVDMAARRKVVIKPTGEPFIFWATPLTLEERERARKEAKRDDSSDFALTMLVAKALCPDGRRRFGKEDLIELRRRCPASLAEAILEKLLSDDEDPDPSEPLEDVVPVVAPSPKRSLAGSSTNGQT